MMQNNKSVSRRSRGSRDMYTEQNSKKNVRRRPRSKREYKSESEAVIIEKPRRIRTRRKTQSMIKDNLSYTEDVPLSFTCTFMSCNSTGHFFRKAKTGRKRIQLKSFVETDETVIFESKVNILVDLLKNLSIGEKINGSKQYRTIKQGNKTQNHLQTNNKRKDRKERRKKRKETFDDYLSIEEINVGLKNGEFVKGFVRINPKNYKDAYVNNEIATDVDYYISSLVDRNRALEGDEVVLKLKPQDSWVDGKRTYQVVFIKQYVHPRIAVGTVKLENENVFFYPRDKRVPLIKVDPVDLPENFLENPDEYKNFLYVVKITSWETVSHAFGKVLENLGLIGDLKVESIAILREFCLDTTPFPDNIVKYLPKTIPQREFEYRTDLRKDLCIFTIDPSTARDLDDAVSVKRLDNGNYEIGVHISDPAFYLDKNTELDEIVRKKGVTIYLVEQVYHMLPVELCLHCSLLPGEDKLAFSVFWEMTKYAEIINQRFERTIVNSCTKLAYEHAQMMIDKPLNELNGLPNILNGYTIENVWQTVNILQGLAVQLRQKRQNNGALKINQIKLSFALDSDSGEPTDFFVYENKAAHRLIEEFMLLANITVAERINTYFPELAFLRCHEPPKHTMLNELKENLEVCGIHIDTSSSGSISSSLIKYITDDYLGMCRGAVLNHLIAKTMTRARYFCAATVDTDEVDGFRHYALSVPIYTHFTSPIRRYADIMVHRLLAASLNYAPAPKWDTDFVQNVAANCNAQKYNAKRAGEASSELYLAKYVEEHQPFVQDAVVVDVKDRSIDAIVLKTGSIIRIYQNNVEEGAKWIVEEQFKKFGSRNEKKIVKIVVKFPTTDELDECDLILSIFSVIKVNLKRKEKSYKLEGTLLRPLNTVVFQSNGL